jgi:hypothetical protein
VVAAVASTEGDESVRIVESAFGAEHSKGRDNMTVPFGVNQNGTELVYVLLDQAARAGAAFVADMAITVTFRWGGQPIECRTRVVFDGDPLLARKDEVAAGPVVPKNVAPRYGTEIDVFEPQKVQFVADDKELDCKLVAGQRLRKVQRAGGARSGETARLGDPAADDTTTEAEVVQREECNRTQVKREAERWDYEVKLGFVPPNWAHLAQRFAEGETLVPARPQCYAIAETELGKEPIYRLTATAYYTGKLKVRLPEELPSRGLIEGQRLRGNESERQCMQRLKQAGISSTLKKEFGEIAPQCLPGGNTQPN